MKSIMSEINNYEIFFWKSIYNHHSFAMYIVFFKIDWMHKFNPFKLSSIEIRLSSYVP